MIIDSHQHFWKYDPVRDSWIDDTMQVIRRDFLPDDLQPELKKNGVKGTVAVQAGQSETETEFLLGLAENNDFIKGVVGWIDLQSDKVASRLEHFSKNPYFKGVRHIVQAEPVDFMYDKAFRNGISKLNTFGLTYDILIFPHQLEAALDLVKTFPDQPFVIDHLAKPYIKKGAISGWKNAMQEISAFDNVYCKISGMFTEADWKHWKKDDFKPYLDVVFKFFGTKRLLYGSDWPVCLLATGYSTQLELLKSYMSDFSVVEKHQVFAQNTVDFYQLSV